MDAARQRTPFWRQESSAVGSKRSNTVENDAFLSKGAIFLSKSKLAGEGNVPMIFCQTYALLDSNVRGSSV